MTATRTCMLNGVSGFNFEQKGHDFPIYGRIAVLLLFRPQVTYIVLLQQNLHNRHERTMVQRHSITFWRRERTKMYFFCPPSAINFACWHGILKKVGQGLQMMSSLMLSFTLILFYAIASHMRSVTARHSAKKRVGFGNRVSRP